VSILLVDFAVLIDFKVNKSLADPATARHEVFIHLLTVEAEQTQRNSDTQQTQLRSQLIIGRYLL